VTESCRKDVSPFCQMTERCRRDVLPFRQILENLGRIYFTIKKLTEGCSRDVLPFCKVTEGRRKMFEHSVKLQKVAAKMFGLSVRKKARKIKIPRIFFLLSEGFSLRF